MNKISCDICLDLIPLVEDDIASEDSRIAVIEHIKECESCRSYYSGKNLSIPEMDDERVIKNCI